MASPIFTLLEFIKYRFRVQNSHHLHSPFLYQLYNEVINRNESLRSRELKTLRARVIQDQLIYYTDPKTNSNKNTTNRSLAKRVSSSHRFSYFLIRLIEHLKYNRILETGTSLGINTSYLSTAKDASVWTIEGSKEIAHQAQRNFERLGIKNVKISVGLVSELFERILKVAAPQLVFLDADHRSATIRFYLDSIKNCSPQVECIVIHDIYWSKDMKSSWESVKNDPKVNLTIDIFEAGIVFPNFPMEKQHFTLSL